MSEGGRSPLGLAVISLANAGDGLAQAARLYAVACDKGLRDGVRVIELGSERAARVSIGARARFTSAVLGAQLFGGVSGVLFAHVGIARAERLLPRWARRPYGVLLNGIEAWDPDLGPDRLLALRRASVRIAISRHTAERAHAAHPEIGPIEPCPLALLPGSTDSGEPADAEVVGRIERRSVLIVGRMSAAERYKGHDLLLEVWPAVRARVRDAQLVVVGRGDDAERLRGKARELGIGASVYFPGFVSDATLRAVRRRAAAFAMPSRGEGFGLVYLEAMRDGLPCIGSVEDAAADIIREAETGYLVSPRDPGALTERLVALLENETLRRQLGAAGMRRLEAEFTVDRFIERFRPLLAPLLGTHPSAAVR